MLTGVKDVETGDPARTSSRAGRVSLAAVLLSVALIIVVGVHGPSAAVPPLDHPGWPPVFRSSHLSDVFVTVTLWAAMGAGATRRRRWAPAGGDPVARLSSRAWSDSPTVYGLVLLCVVGR